jgi:hypothetical protein
MDVINLKEKGVKIPNLYQYEVIAKMNNHNFTLVRVKDRTLDFHTRPDRMHLRCNESKYYEQN